MTTDTDALVKALRSQKQCDEDGIMCIVSRQACDQAAALIERLSAEVSEEDKRHAAASCRRLMLEKEDAMPTWDELMDACLNRFLTRRLTNG